MKSFLLDIISFQLLMLLMYSVCLYSYYPFRYGLSGFPEELSLVLFKKKLVKFGKVIEYKVYS